MKANIEAERVRKQMTRQELCDTLGITTRTYSNYLKGVTAIPSDVLIGLANLFKCSTDYLLGREGLAKMTREEHLEFREMLRQNESKKGRDCDYQQLIQRCMDIDPDYGKSIAEAAGFSVAGEDLLETEYQHSDTAGSIL